MTAASLAASRLNGDSGEGEMTMADFRAAARREKDGYSLADKRGQLGF